MGERKGRLREREKVEKSAYVTNMSALAVAPSFLLP